MIMKTKMKMKKTYISPCTEIFSVQMVQLFATSVRPTTTDSSETDFDKEKQTEWGEIEF